MDKTEHRPGAALPTARVLQGEASQVVAALLGDDVRSAETIGTGMMTFKCLVRVRRGDAVIVRFYPPRRSYVVDQEPDLLARCHAAGMPVPRVIGDSRAGPKSVLSYIAYSMLEGSALSGRVGICESVERQALARDLALELAKHTTVEFAGFGELVSGHKASSSRWSSFVEESIGKGVDAIRRHSLLDRNTYAQLCSVVERRELGTQEPGATLVWGDITFDNILVDSRCRLVGLIDFESCLSGDPLATLGYCFAVHGENPFFSSLLDSWPTALTSEDRRRVYFYAILRGLRLAPYAHLPLPTGRPRDPLLRIFPGIVPALEALRG